MCKDSKNIIVVKTYFRYLLFLILALTFHSRVVSANMNENVSCSTDSVIIFRFIPKDLMFYDSQKLGFRESLFRALDLINSHKEDIVSGKAVVVIHGYCTSFPTYEANRKAAKNRSNQVKSYFITNYWMKEKYYKTRNHVDTYLGNREIVAVVGIEYLPGYEPKKERSKFKPIVSQTFIPVPSAEMYLNARTMASVSVTTTKVEAEEGTRGFHLPLILKSNLIYDAMLAPSLEIEYIIKSIKFASYNKRIFLFHYKNNKLLFANEFKADNHQSALYLLLHVWKNLEFDAYTDECIFLAPGEYELALMEKVREYLKSVYELSPTVLFRRTALTRIPQIPFDLLTLLLLNGF